MFLFNINNLKFEEKKSLEFEKTDHFDTKIVFKGERMVAKICSGEYGCTLRTFDHDYYNATYEAVRKW